MYGLVNRLFDGDLIIDRLYLGSSCYHEDELKTKKIN